MSSFLSIYFAISYIFLADKISSFFTFLKKDLFSLDSKSAPEALYPPHFAYANFGAMIVIKKDKNMIEVNIKIDGKSVTVNGNSVQTEGALDNLYDEMFKGIKSKDFQNEYDVYNDFNEVTGNTRAPKQHLHQKPPKLENYLYDNVLYAKVGTSFMRFIDDNVCQQIASSTYYKYKKRLADEA